MNRKTIRILLGLAGLVVACVIGLYTFLSPDRLRRMIVPEIESSLGRKVELEGVGLSLWGGVAASVEGLTIHERQGFGDRPFLSAGEARFAIEFWPILTGQTTLGGITITRPTISYVIDANGEANIDDIVGGTVEEDATPGEPFVLPASTIRLTDGTLHYEDHRDGTRLEISDVNYDLRASLEPPELRLAGTLSIGDIRSGGESIAALDAFQMVHRIRVEGQDIVVESIRVSAAAFAVEVSGRITSVDALPTIDLSFRDQQVDLADLSGLGIELQGRLSISGSVQGTLNSNANPPVYPVLDLSVSGRSLIIRSPDVLVPLLVHELALGVRNDRVMLRRLDVAAGRSDIHVSATVQNVIPWPPPTSPAPLRPQIDFHMTSRVLDLDEMLPVVSSSALDWAFTTPAFAAPETEPSVLPDIVRSLDGKGRVEIDELVNAGVVANDVRFNISLLRKHLTVRPMGATVHGGQLLGSLELDASTGAEHLPFRAVLDLTAVQAQRLLKDQLGWPLPLYGAGRVQVSAHGTVDPALEIVTEDLKANGSLSLKEGRLINWPLLKKATSAVEGLSFFNADTVVVRDLHSPFQVKDGRVHLDIQLIADEMPARISGSGGLDGTLDFNLDLDVPASPLNVSGLNLSGLISSLFGSQEPMIPVRIRMTGSTRRPAFGVTIQPSGKKETQKEQTDAKEKVSDKAKSFLKRFGR